MSGVGVRTEGRAQLVGQRVGASLHLLECETLISENDELFAGVLRVAKTSEGGDKCVGKGACELEGGHAKRILR